MSLPKFHKQTFPPCLWPLVPFDVDGEAVAESDGEPCSGADGKPVGACCLPMLQNG